MKSGAVRKEVEMGWWGWKTVGEGANPEESVPRWEGLEDSSDHLQLG